MTSATSRQNIRRALYEQIPGLGFNSTATSLTATTLTDAAIFADTNLDNNTFKGAYIYRPDRAAADQVRRITTFVNTTGVVTQGGGNWSNTADTNYEVVGLMHPDELNACIQRAQQRIYRDVQLPMCGELETSDGDMETSGVGSWSAVGTPATQEKSTTASRIFDGTQALHVLNDAAAEGAQSVTIRGFPTNGGEWIYLSAVVHADVGTAEMHLYNVTASSSIANVTSAEEGFVHLWLYTSLPTGCEEIAVRLLGTENTADLYWSHVVLYRREAMRVYAPSWLDEQWKFLKLREARYQRSLSNQTSGGYDDATSRTFADWVQPAHFSLDPLHLDANPYAIQLRRPLPQRELWIQGKRPFSDSEALATDSATTLAPLRQEYAYSKEEIAKILHKRYPSDKRWDVLLAEAQAEVLGETQSRPDLPLSPMRREYWGRA